MRRCPHSMSETTPTSDEQPPASEAGDSPADERTVLERVAAGDPAAVRECLDSYSGLVWTIARRMLGAGHDTEDAVQEIFVEIWRSATRFDRTKGTDVQFVSTIARRRVVDRVRRRGRQPKLEPLPERLTSSAPGADRDAVVADEYARAREALESLPPQRQRVLRMALLAGVSHRQIAEQTGIPLGTVKTHVRRGLIRIRELLEVDQGGDRTDKGGDGGSGGDRGGEESP